MDKMTETSRSNSSHEHRSSQSSSPMQKICLFCPSLADYTTEENGSGENESKEPNFEQILRKHLLGDDDLKIDEVIEKHLNSKLPPLCCQCHKRFMQLVNFVFNSENFLEKIVRMARKIIQNSVKRDTRFRSEKYDNIVQQYEREQSRRKMRTNRFIKSAEPPKSVGDRMSATEAAAAESAAIEAVTINRGLSISKTSSAVAVNPTEKGFSLKDEYYEDDEEEDEGNNEMYVPIANGVDTSNYLKRRKLERVGNPSKPIVATNDYFEDAEDDDVYDINKFLKVVHDNEEQLEKEEEDSYSNSPQNNKSYHDDNADELYKDDDQDKNDENGNVGDDFRFVKYCKDLNQKKRKSVMVFRRRKWTEEEDDMIRKFVAETGATNWSKIASQLGTHRIGKQVRERWKYHLDPAVNKNPWSEDEDRILIEARCYLGNKWSEIAKLLPGRRDNSVKNRWYGLLRKNPDAVGSKPNY